MPLKKPAKKSVTEVAGATAPIADDATPAPVLEKAIASADSDAPATDATATYEDRVRQRAYERYQERGAAEGDAHADWLAAEQDIASSTRPG